MMLPGETEVFTATHGNYELSTERSRLDFEFIFEFMKKKTYWDGKRETLERAIANSIPFGVYDKDGKQVAFARAVTDFATVASLWDVEVDPKHRGNRLGVWLGKVVMDHPNLNLIKFWSLATTNAHGVYEASGWTILEGNRTMIFERKVNTKTEE